MRQALVLFLFLSFLAPLGAFSQIISVVQKADCNSNTIILRVNLPKTQSENFCVNYLDRKDNLFYFKTCDNLLFDDAEKVGQWLGGHLATANTQVLNEFIAKIHPSTHWIGYKQNPNSALFNDPPDASSGFEWLSGAQVKDVFWKNGEPDNNELNHPGMTTVQNCDASQPGLWCDAEPELYFEGIIETQNPIIPNTNVSILWSTGQTTPTITIEDPSVSLVTLKLSNAGKTYSFDVALDSLRLSKKLSFPTQNIYSQSGSLIQLQASDKNASDFYWTPDVGLSNLFSSKTTFIFNGNKTEYTVKFKDANACPNEEKFIIQEANRLPFSIPSAFSPNHDSLNDFFQLYSENSFDSFQITIYNKWGNIVFSSQQSNFVWDGTLNQSIVPSDLYMVEIQYEKKHTIRLPLYVIY